MFKITDAKGFHITYDNGYTISVQFGYYNYCTNYNRRDETHEHGVESITAEVAIWNHHHDFITNDFLGNNDVLSRQTPSEVLKAMIWAEAQ